MPTVRLPRCAHAHVLLLRRPEAVQLGLHRVGARIDEVEEVAAVGVA